MVSCEFYKISKNTFFIEHLWKTAFANQAMHAISTCGFVQINLRSSEKKTSVFARDCEIVMTKSPTSEVVSLYGNWPKGWTVTLER